MFRCGWLVQALLGKILIDMTETAIRVKNLSKRYVLGASTGSGPRYRTLRESVQDTIQASFRRLRQPTRPTNAAAGEEFWAVRDVSFEVRTGEVVGIIGRNGAGKSTLLKLLSRITEPTSGSIAIRGRVASLLEVGTGFHPELTGRENIFLNGAILGMSRVEIKAKFDEIVAFSEVERFLDTPVKRYSSGMYVRLAFAVAAHLEPEVLVVDEVLAVGDAQFQKKCLGKMQDVSREGGRTILFVSHQMSAVENLCTRVIVLGAGAVMFDGPTKAAIRFYLNELEKRTQSVDLRSLSRKGNGAIRLTAFSLLDDAGRSLSAVASGDTIRFALDYERDPAASIGLLNVGFSIHTQLGDILSIYYSDFGGHSFSDVPLRGRVVCTIADFPFSPGRYYVGTRVLADGAEADWPQDFVGVLDVEEGDFYGSGTHGQHSLGPILLRGDWQIHGTANTAST